MHLSLQHRRIPHVAMKLLSSQYLIVGIKSQNHKNHPSKYLWLSNTIAQQRTELKKKRIWHFRTRTTLSCQTLLLCTFKCDIRCFWMSYKGPFKDPSDNSYLKYVFLRCERIYFLDTWLFALWQKWLVWSISYNSNIYLAPIKELSFKEKNNIVRNEKNI